MTHEIKHHLSDDVMMGFATGSLPEAFNLMAATHISLCNECRALLGAYDTVGGELLNAASETEAVMSTGSLARTMALIADGPKEGFRPPRKTGATLPGPVQDYVGGDLESVKWRGIGMGVKQAILPTTKDASARLLFIPAGTAMPDHGHQGIEMTMVLQGAFQDDNEYFARGDVEMADSDLHHTPIADIHEDCICLAVTDAPLKFEGLLPKIVQRFARI